MCDKSTKSHVDLDRVDARKRNIKRFACPANSFWGGYSQDLRQFWNCLMLESHVLSDAARTWMNFWISSALSLVCCSSLSIMIVIHLDNSLLCRPFALWKHPLASDRNTFSRNLNAVIWYLWKLRQHHATTNTGWNPTSLHEYHQQG